jgi:hypothetical protein
MSNCEQAAVFCGTWIKKDIQMKCLRRNDDAQRTKAGIKNTKKYTLQYGNSKRFFG